LKVAMPRFGEEIAPCFEYSATIAIFTVERKQVIGQMDFTLQSRESLDRVRLLADQQVDVLICGGIQKAFESLVRARGIQVYSWLEGQVEDLLDRFIKGQFTFDSDANDSDRGAIPRDREGGRIKR
jgi:predicted Fe-Mo cluster-binding NifX family protein